MYKAKVGIIGAAGYTGGELIRILLNHPYIEIKYIFSRSQNGKKIDAVHQDLFDVDLQFTNEFSDNVNVLFLCLPHGETKNFLSDKKIKDTVKIIDLSNDFRLKENAKDFVYGLPELNKSRIKYSDYIANPGCFATSIQLALLPLAKEELLVDEVHISAITGSTGAGVKLLPTTHFTWRNNNVSVYKAFVHQHLGEINQSLKQLQKDFDKPINFIPYRGNFSRGIIATSYTTYSGSEEEAYELYKNYYQDHPFVYVHKNPVHIKQVVNTNNCFIQLQKHNGKLIIISAIDNLLKGASGQAVQNMNLILGYDERQGLNLKASAF